MGFSDDDARAVIEAVIKLFDDGLLPDCMRLYPENDFIFQQDGAPSHTSNATQTHLEQAVPHFIKKDEWPPQSPDLNPGLHYGLHSLKRSTKDAHKNSQRTN